MGLSLMTVPVAVMCCFNDDRSLGESSEAKRCGLDCFPAICFVCQTHFHQWTAPVPVSCGTPMTPWAALMSPASTVHMHASLQIAHVAAAGHMSGRGQPQEPAEALRPALERSGRCLIVCSRHSELAGMPQGFCCEQLVRCSRSVRCCCRAPKREKSTAELTEARWAREERGCCGAACAPTVLIPALILFSDLIGSLASGATSDSSWLMPLTGHPTSMHRVLLCARCHCSRRRGASMLHGVTCHLQQCCLIWGVALHDRSLLASLLQE